MCFALPAINEEDIFHQSNRAPCGNTFPLNTLSEFSRCFPSCAPLQASLLLGTKKKNLHRAARKSQCKIQILPSWKGGWHGLGQSPQEVVESPTLELFRKWVDEALGDMVNWPESFQSKAGLEDLGGPFQLLWFHHCTLKMTQDSSNHHEERAASPERVIWEGF